MSHAIDTAAKRSSALDHEEVWQFGLPIPDGSADQGDRQHLAWSYSGILAGAAAVTYPTVGGLMVQGQVYVSGWIVGDVFVGGGQAGEVF